MRQDDEAAIRALVSTWMEATRTGDTAKVLELMADDVVFLVAGRPPFGKREFEAATTAQAARRCGSTAQARSTRFALLATGPSCAPGSR
jgi:uncharacterized protein (TIGR02246 family)